MLLSDPMDALDDLCPICDNPILEGEQWTIHDGQIAHEHCAFSIEEREEIS